MNLKFLKARLAVEPNETQPDQKYIFLVKSQELAMNLVLAGFAAVSIGNDGVSIRDFHEMIRNLEPGKTNAIRYLFALAMTKKTNDEIRNHLKAEGLYSCDAWQIFYKKDYLSNIANVEALRQSVNNFIDSREKVVPAPKVNLLKFHHVKNGKITGVFHDAIFRHLKETENIFVIGSTPYIYTNGVFRPDVSGAKIKTMIRQLIFPEFVKSTTINNIFQLFMQDADLEKTFDELNDYPAHWINFKNAMYDPIKKIFFPHDPKYLSINQIPHEFDTNVKHDGGKIEEFISFICPKADDREMLLEYGGYCLTRDTAQQKFLLLTGTGGTGKSTIIRLLEKLVGSENISNIALADLSQRFSSFSLMGMLLNSCADLEREGLEDVSMLKKMLGEDRIKGEAKGKNAIFFTNYAKMIFSANEVPVIRAERTNGFYRRLLIFSMNRSPAKQNPNLFTELEAQIDYLLCLCVQALSRMYENGTIVVSDSAKKATSQLRVDSDSVEAFLEEYCIKESSSRTERLFLYNKYNAFCDETDRTSLTRNNFYRAMRSKGYTESKSGDWYFMGIKYEKYGVKVPNKTSQDGFISVTQEELDDLPFK